MRTKKNTIQICVTKKCNYNCCYCFSPVNSITDDDLDIDTWRIVITKILNVASVCDIKKVNFVGGEPLLFPGLIELIELCYNKRMACSLTTNGSLLDEHIISSLKGKISSIGLSIDSIIPEINNRIGRCSQGKSLEFTDILKISTLLIKYNVPLKVVRVMSSLNWYENPESLLNNICFQRLKLLNVYLNEGINSTSAIYRLSDNDFELACKKYANYSPEIETNQTISNAYFMINSNGDIVISKDGIIENFGSILCFSENELINIWS